MPVSANKATTMLRAAILIATLSCLPILSNAAPVAPGTSYKIIRPVYLSAVYESMTAKHAGAKPATAYLQAELYARTRWIAYRCAIPEGTIMTVIGPAPPAKDLAQRYDAYYVTLKPNASPQTTVVLQLFRGFGDASGGPSAKYFEQANGADAATPVRDACIAPAS
jgi:hypothetical protein